MPVTMPDGPIAYIERTRSYYAALGHQPYVWARFGEVPFRRLEKPLPDLRVALVTTAAPYDPAKGDQGPRAPYNSAAKFYRVYSCGTEIDPDLRISHIAIDRHHTTAEDQATYFPLAALRRSAERGIVGPLSPRFHGLPTNRSKRTTTEVDCVALVQRINEDGADAAILVPNCPVCHQSCALAARALEAAGIATVVMGAALDIVENVGVPRFLFSDFPLGNSAGRPHDLPSQDATLKMALHLLVQATAPRTTHRSPLKWSEDPSWKLDYCNVARLSPPEVEERARQYAASRPVAKAMRAQS